MPRASAVATVPPELDKYVSSKKLRTLQPRQRDAVLSVLQGGAFSPEEAGCAVEELADNTFGQVSGSAQHGQLLPVVANIA